MPALPVPRGHKVPRHHGLPPMKLDCFTLAAVVSRYTRLPLLENGHTVVAVMFIPLRASGTER
eukprot:52685-Eustigmatos_ZCMA.PRE.1